MTSAQDLTALGVEQAVLGACLSDPAQWRLAAQRLSAQDFEAPLHQELWTVISRMALSGKGASGHAIAAHFRDAGRLDEIEGGITLAALMDNACFGAEIVEFCEMIADASARRRLVKLAADLKRLSEQPVNDKGVRLTPAQIIDRAQSQIMGVATTLHPPTSELAATLTARALTEAMRMDARSGLETGLLPLDKKTGGLHRQELAILGGRPSMGKSALGDQIAHNIAQSGRRVMLFSLEMSAQYLAYRAASRMAHARTGKIVAYSRLRDPRRMPDDEFKALADQVRQIPNTLEWDTTPGIDLSHVRAALGLARDRGRPLDLVVIDYLQLMDARRERMESEAAAIGRLTKGLKLLAREFDCAILALSQLSRNVEARADKRPQLSDLRDSGSIEQDADAVWFAYRHHYYLSREPEPKDGPAQEQRAVELAQCEPELDVLVQKQRMGPVCDVRLWWSAETSWITGARTDLSQERPSRGYREDMEMFP